jgi:energy-coupling factor transporter ATP-binding protein EcfA2
VTDALKTGFWRLERSEVGPLRPEELRRFRSTLRSAVRVAHGLKASFSLVATSGPAGEIGLLPHDPASRRWLTRAFLPAYPTGSWRPGASSAETRENGRRLFAHRTCGWPVPFRSDEESASGLDNLELALRTLGGGLEVTWELTPSALRSPPVAFEGALETRSVGAPLHHAPRRRSERLANDLGGECFWQARLSIFAREPGDSLASGARIVESALRSGLGSTVRFRSGHWTAPWNPPFLLTDRDLAMTLPGPTTVMPLATRTAAEVSRPRWALGRTDTGDLVGPALDPDEGRHLAILGETGMGKSSLLVTLARSAAEDGGVILFDPVGETAEALRSLLGAKELTRTTFVTPLADPGINALAGISGADADGVARERHLNDLVHSLRRVRSGRYADAAYWGPRLEEMLVRALTVASALPEGTLADAHLLLASGGRGFRTLPSCAIDAATALGERIRARPEDAEGARRLLYEVVRSPVLLRALARRRPTVDLRTLTAPGRILILSGDAHRVGEANARFFLSVYLALVWSTVLARPTRPKSFLLLDEAQWFAHESLAEMLRLGRRRNLHVVLATQSLASLPPPVADAVWTNVADFVAFRGSPDEAREFARLARGVAAETILALPRGRAAALIGKGESVQWVRTVHRPIGSPHEADRLLTAPADPSTFADDRVAERAVLHRLSEASTGSVVRVVLSQLAPRGQFDGATLRRLGSRLGRAGAIVRTERTPNGTAWWLDPTRATSVLRAPAPEERNEGAASPQPS